MATTGEPATRAVEWTLEAAGRLQRTVTSLPSPAAGEILVNTVAGAISPGIERTLLHGTCPAVNEHSYPYQPGSLNVVRIVGAADRTLLGERGVAVLGHRDRALIPYHRFIRVPPAVSDELALLGVIAADARQAIDVASVESTEDCLVVGGGIVGVLAAWELASRTSGTIRLVEIDAERRRQLEEIRFPADVTVAAEPGRGKFHTVFDCANSPGAFALAQSAVRRNGSIVLLADGGHESYALTPDFFAKALYLGKTDSHPDLRGFFNDWVARHEDRSSLVEVAFREELRFTDFPQAYLEALLRAPAEREGLLPKVLYG